MPFSRVRLRLRRNPKCVVRQRADFARFLKLLPNILIPQVRVSADEFAHQADTLCVVEDDDTGAVLPEEVFRTLKVTVLPNDDAGNTKEQCRAGTHDAGTQRADQGQFSPIAPAARVAQTHRFGVRGRIATLHSQVVSSGHNLSLLIRENRADGQASLAQTGPRFRESLEQ